MKHIDLLAGRFGEVTAAHARDGRFVKAVKHGSRRGAGDEIPGELRCRRNRQLKGVDSDVGAADGIQPPGRPFLGAEAPGGT